MATFITLTEKSDGMARRVKVDAITQYFAYHGETYVFVGADQSSVRVTETPEQIDAMLGVTESPAVAALDGIIEWAFKTHGESWDSVTTPGPVVAACFALRAARGE